jgi:hypothetical protein
MCRSVAHPACRPVSTGVPSQGVYIPDKSPPPSSEEKFVELYIHFPLRLHGLVLNHRDSVTLHVSCPSQGK